MIVNYFDITYSSDTNGAFPENASEGVSPKVDVRNKIE